MVKKHAQSGFPQVDIVNGTIAGARLVDYVEDQLRREKRWAQTVVSSWSSEPGDLPSGKWMARDSKGRPASVPSSLDCRCALQMDRSYESHRVNGKRGGRPPRQRRVHELKT